VAIPSEKPDPIAVALDDQAKAVVLGSWSQSEPAGTFVPLVGMQGMNLDVGMPHDVGRDGQESSRYERCGATPRRLAVIPSSSSRRGRATDVVYSARLFANRYVNLVELWQCCLV
jgi:hypothetical protein